MFYSEVDFYDGDQCSPVYEWNYSDTHYSLEKLAQILLNVLVPSKKWCIKQPVHVQKNVSFVVNVSILDDPMDVRADENDVWMCKDSPVAYVSKHNKGDATLYYQHKDKSSSYLLQDYENILPA